jgi:8-oxo-dGTP pyrophosphatase MutT (NUDIX family)
MPRPGPDCVGALILDARNRVYLQRRSLRRRQLPGAWDIVGGHIEPGETREDALAREVREETGWELRRIEGMIEDWEWEHNGRRRREQDFLVEVNGDLKSPRLEPGKHDDFRWVGFENTERIRSDYDAGNDRLWEIIGRAARIRLTSTLRLEPIGPKSADALRSLGVAGAATLANRMMPVDDAPAAAAEFGRSWDQGRSLNWLAYSRSDPGLPVGYGGLAPERIDGKEQLMLQCAIPPDEQHLGPAIEIMRAVLAFAHNELQIDQVFASVAAGNQWAKGVLDQSYMQFHGVIDVGDSYQDLFKISFGDDTVYDQVAEVTTGIGQILAVPDQVR